MQGSQRNEPFHTGVDVGLNDALLGRAAGLLLSRGEALLAEELGGSLDVAIALDKRLLAIHHARASRIAKRLDGLRVNSCATRGWGVLLSAQQIHKACGYNNSSNSLDQGPNGQGGAPAAMRANPLLGVTTAAGEAKKGCGESTRP
mgnify:CR=1 FL=1